MLTKLGISVSFVSENGNSRDTLNLLVLGGKVVQQEIYYSETKDISCFAFFQDGKYYSCYPTPELLTEAPDANPFRFMKGWKKKSEKYVSISLFPYSQQLKEKHEVEYRYDEYLDYADTM